MNITPTALPDVILIKPSVFADDRGFFVESFNHGKFNAAVGYEVRFVQHNHSRSVKNVVRGLHYQVAQPQGKLVHVMAGEIWDVAVDIRPGSATLGQWTANHLSADNLHQVWIPPGFAHGFVVTSPTADVLYYVTDYYAPRHERCIAWNDPALALPWPLDGPAVLSPKDQAGITLDEAVAEITRNQAR